MAATLRGGRPVRPLAERSRPYRNYREAQRPAPTAPTAPQPVQRVPTHRGGLASRNAGRVPRYGTPAPIGEQTSFTPGPPGSAVVPRDFFADAKLLYPWLPQDLLRAFAARWGETGDANLALGAMREHPSYDVHFAGNRRQDGSLRMSEQEYMATVEGYNIQWARYGVNPNVVKGKHRTLIEGEVSAAEFGARLNAVYEGVQARIPEVREFYARNYGLAMTDEAIFASAADPGIGRDILDRRINVAQVGGFAARYGFHRARGRVEELIGSGTVTGQNAATFYGAAQQRVGLFDAMARRHHDRLGGVGVEEYEDAFALNDRTATERISRNLQAEQASFSRRGSAATDREGRVLGLQDR